MGSFTPWGAETCVAGSCWGTLTSVLIIASPTSGAKALIKVCACSGTLRRASLAQGRLRTEARALIRIKIRYESKSSLRTLLNDRHQFGWLAGGSCSLFRFFPHVRNLDAFQNRFDALIHLAQRFADVATIALAALPANRNTGCDEQRAVDGLNYFESRDRVRGAGQPVTAVGTVLRMQ